MLSRWQVSISMSDTIESSQEHSSESAQEKHAQNQAYFPITGQLTNEAKEEAPAGVTAQERNVEFEGKFQGFLKAINEEASQLAQFLVQERKLVKELCTLLTQILRNLKISFAIPSEYLVALDEEAKQVRLSRDGHLQITRSDNKVDSRPLEEHSPEIILKVLLVIIPELERMIKACRRDASRRIGLFEKIRRELKAMQEALALLDREARK